MPKKRRFDDDWDIDEDGPSPDRGIPPWEDVYKRKQKNVKPQNKRMGRKKPPRQLSEAE